MEVDRTECDCDTKALVATERADWKAGKPTGTYCQRCGYVFGYEGGYEP